MNFNFSISVIFCRVFFFFWMIVGTLTYHKIKKINVLGEMTGRNGWALFEVKLVPEGGKGCTASIWLGSSKESPTSASQVVSLTHWPGGVLLQPRIRSCSLQNSACLAHKQCNSNQKKKKKTLTTSNNNLKIPQSFIEQMNKTNHVLVMG